MTDSGRGPRVEAVVIGASAGAIQALSEILPALPADFALPVLAVVHVPPDRKNALSALFARRCLLPVREAEDKEPLAPGTITFAPPNYHMLVETDRTIALSTDEPVHFSRPSIDVLFESAADAFGPNLLAVVLTGANEDGARGLLAVARAGGTSLVQDPASAPSPEMPRAASSAVPQARVETLRMIAEQVIKAGRR